MAFCRVLDVRSFGEDLGRMALARDWAGVHQLLAPWMQQSLTVDQVRAFFEDEYKSTLEENEYGATAMRRSSPGSSQLTRQRSHVLMTTLPPLVSPAA